MVRFAERRLQVFVSSTYSDLIAERQAAVEAILRSGHIPAGMELFSAGDETQMELIRQWIDASDVFLLILGARYGSVEPKTGKSYTQIEYEYAVSKGMPSFACVIDESTIASRADELRGMLHSDDFVKLASFRAAVLSRVVRFWRDTKDIQLAISDALSGISRRHDLLGWIRASELTNLRHPIPSLDLTWLYSVAAILEVERTVESREIWVASPHLANDTGVLYDAAAPINGSPSTVQTAQSNLRRHVHYTFIVPDTERIALRLPQLNVNYGAFPGQLRVVILPPDVFESVSHSELVIYNPRLEARRPPRVFLELPVATAHQYWAELDDDASYAILARLRHIISDPLMVGGRYVS